MTENHAMDCFEIIYLFKQEIFVERLADKVYFLIVSRFEDSRVAINCVQQQEEKNENLYMDVHTCMW